MSISDVNRPRSATSPDPRPDSAVRIALLFPDLLGTYGDGGNATILAQRLRWRGHLTEVVTIRSGDPVPGEVDLYVVGGGEDLPQALAARQLAQPDTLRRAVDRGAVVFAVCAGIQILGTDFHVGGPDGGRSAGLGLVDVSTAPGTGPRAVGELVVDANPTTGLPTLTGYENHGGVTTLGPGVEPLGLVRTGIGNGTPPHSPVADGATADQAGRNGDGYLTGHVLGTYLHGPALARNPALADLLLSWVVGADLAPLDDGDSERLRAERLRVAAGQASAGARPAEEGKGRRITDRLHVRR